MTESESHRVLCGRRRARYHRARRLSPRQGRVPRDHSRERARTALRTAREERPDLVVLDLMLPGASGYDVLAELRRREETKDLGIILLTARKDEPDRIKGLSLGATTISPNRSRRRSWCCGWARCCAGWRRRPSRPAASSPPGRSRWTAARTGSRWDAAEIELTANRVQTAAHLDRGAKAACRAAPSCSKPCGRPIRHPDAHRGHARSAAASEARQAGDCIKTGPRRGLPFPVDRPLSRAAASGRVKLATRLFVTTTCSRPPRSADSPIAADRLCGATWRTR